MFPEALLSAISSGNTEDEGVREWRHGRKGEIRRGPSKFMDDGVRGKRSLT